MQSLESVLRLVIETRTFSNALRRVIISSMRIYTSALIAALAVYFFNKPGLEGLYVNVWWYDIFMHILGGFSVGLLLSLISSAVFKDRPLSPYKIILGTLVFGLGWEFLEVYFNVTGHPIGSSAYYLDTAKDILDDIIGSSVAVYIFKKLL